MIEIDNAYNAGGIDIAGSLAVRDPDDRREQAAQLFVVQILREVDQPLTAITSSSEPVIAVRGEDAGPVAAAIVAGAGVSLYRLSVA